MATKVEKEYLQNALHEIGQNSDQLPHREITALLPMVGENYSGELMVIGRAVNGWLDGVMPSELADPKISERYAEAVYKNSNAGKPCPMSWVVNQWQSTTEYNTAKSAFWRVIKQVVSELDKSTTPNNWSSHLVWSNLYKIAPSNGGNPGSTLAKLQLEQCKSLFDLEIETYLPSRVLFLTGWGWAHDFISSPTRIDIHQSALVEASGKITSRNGETIDFVVAKHPQGKNESAWVDDVINTFVLLDS